MSTSQQKALDDFVQLRNRNAMVHVIRTAVDLGILQALSTGQKTIEQLAEQLNLKQEPLVRLMNVLANSELVDRYGDDFALSTIAKLIPSPNLGLWRSLLATTRPTHSRRHAFARR
jgi:predicted transcriptional regulator